MLSAIAPILIFIAFLLLLLVSLSVPIIKSIYLFKLNASISSSLFNTGASASARFGVWGYCLSAIDVSVVGIDHDTNAQCSKAHLGYDFDTTVANALHVNGIENAISRTVTAVLVLHPIACGFAFLALLSSLFVLRRNGGASRAASLCTLGTGLLAALLTTVVFLIDVIAVAVVRHRVSNETDGDAHLTWGNAVWMTLGATIALWGALVGACAGLFRGGRRPRNPDKY